MQRGNLVIYDKAGTIWYQSGEAEGDILPHDYPSGLSYIEIPFGTMATKTLIKIDTSNPNNSIPVFKKISRQLTYEELQQQLLIAQGVI